MAALQFAHATVQRSPPAQQSPSSPLVDQALWPAWQVLTPCPMISGTHALVCSHSQMQGRVSAEAAAAATSLTLILGLPPSLRGHLYGVPSESEDDPCVHGAGATQSLGFLGLSYNSTNPKP